MKELAKQQCALEAEKHRQNQTVQSHRSLQSVQDRLAQVASEQHSLRSEINSVQSRLPQLCPTIQGQGNAASPTNVFRDRHRLLWSLLGDYGFLASAFGVREAALKHDAKWMEPLGLLLEKHLFHRICLDTAMARTILDANQNKSGFTIWYASHGREAMLRGKMRCCTLTRFAFQATPRSAHGQASTTRSALGGDQEEVWQRQCLRSTAAAVGERRVCECQEPH